MTAKGIKNCLIKLFILILLLLILSLFSLLLNAIRLKKYVIKLLILFLLYFILFLIDIRLKKYAIKFFQKKQFVLKYCLDRYKSQEICDKAVDACLPALKFVPDGFVTTKML